MKIAIGSDHAAMDYRLMIIEYCRSLGYETEDFGAPAGSSLCYADVAGPVAKAVAAGQADRGLLICGSGVGMSMAANKVRGIRCVVCSEPYSAEMSRLHNDANILAFGARVVGTEVAKRLVEIFLKTPFEGGRHIPRVERIMALEKEERRQ